MAQGVQYLPIRYPREAPSWFVSFMDTFIKDVLTNADVRNAVPGNGIEITGQPDQPATISNGADVQQLIDENYLLAEPSTFLVNARVLAGENGVVSVTDEGPSGNVTIGLYDGGIPWTKLGELDELSVLGNPANSFGDVAAINASGSLEVLGVNSVGDALEFRDPTTTRGATWVISTGVITVPTVDVMVRCYTGGTIKKVTVLTAGGTGSCVIDIWKDSYANFPPTVSDSICGATKPTISGGVKHEDDALTDWDTTINAGDVLLFHLDSTSTFSYIFIQLDIA